VEAGGAPENIILETAAVKSGEPENTGTNDVPNPMAVVSTSTAEDLKSCIGSGDYALFFSLFYDPALQESQYRYLGLYVDGRVIMITVAPDVWREEFGSHDKFAEEFRFGGGLGWNGEGYYRFDGDDKIVADVVNKQNQNKVTVKCYLDGPVLWYDSFKDDVVLLQDLAYEYVGQVKNGVLTTFS